MNESSNPDPNPNPPTSSGQSIKRKVEPLIDFNESQLLTPEQLNLPTLSVLESDLASKLDNYRPKEIIHNDSPARELVGNAIPPKRSADDGWEIARGLLEGFPHLPLQNIRTVKATEEAWWLDAIVSQTKQPVDLIIPRRTFNRANDHSWPEFKEGMLAIDTPYFPKVVYSGLLLGDFPLIATEKIVGPYLFECHAGVHLPTVSIDWNVGHGHLLLCLLAHMAEALCRLHSCSAWMGHLDWHSIQISTADGYAKLMHWDVVPWLFELQTMESIESYQQKDRELFGRLIYLMVYQPHWHNRNWRPLFEQSAATIASTMQCQTVVPKELSLIVARCINAPKSQRYAQTQQLADDLKQLLDLDQASTESTNRRANPLRASKPLWRRLFQR